MARQIPLALILFAAGDFILMLAKLGLAWNIKVSRSGNTPQTRRALSVTAAGQAELSGG
jgi:hypothetical protein